MTSEEIHERMLRGRPRSSRSMDETMSDRERIETALAIIVRYKGFDGAHHKDWVLDQAVRALTGCPALTNDRSVFGTSEEYLELVREAKAGDVGPDTYSWDVGIPP